MKNVVIIAFEFVACSNCLWSDKKKFNEIFKIEIFLNHLLQHSKTYLMLVLIQCSFNVKMDEN